MKNEEKEAKLDFSEEIVEEENLGLLEGKIDLNDAKIDFPEVSEKEEDVSEKEADVSEKEAEDSGKELSEKEADSSEEKVEKVDLPEKLSSPSPTLLNNEKPAEEEADSNRNVTSPVVLESVVLDSVEQGS